MAQPPPEIGPSGSQEPPGNRRLDSWKEIAGYLKRDVATVRRWEKREGLPVHRHHHDKLGSAYAYAQELDAWREGRHQNVEQNQPRHPGADGTPGAPTAKLQWWSRRIVLGTALSLFVLAAGVPAAVWLAQRTVPTAAAPGITSIAVLPFQPLGGSARDETLELGMADALITRLSNVDQIQVRPMSAVQQYQESGRGHGAAGRELNVDALVEGKIQRSGDRIRVTVQLLRVRDGASLWAGTFDEQFTDIFAVQDSISQQVARVLPLTLSTAEARGLTKRDTSNAQAYQLYLKGRYFQSKRTRDGLTKAVEDFEQAITLDPTYALAYAGLADSLASWSNFTIIPSKEAYTRARAAAREGLELDETLADAHTALGVVSLFHDWDWPSAERAFKRAIALEPHDATGYRHYALGLMWLGRFDEAIREIRRARELAPVDVEIHHNLGLILYWARRYDEAISEARKTLEMELYFPQAHRTVAKALVEKGLYVEAIAEFDKAITLGAIQLTRAELGHAYARSGRRGEARTILEELKVNAKGRHVSPYDRAILYVGLGEKDAAFEWLEKSFAERERWMLQLKVAPFLDPLRSDPRFADLVRRVGVWE